MKSRIYMKHGSKHESKSRYLYLKMLKKICKETINESLELHRTSCWETRTHEAEIIGFVNALFSSSLKTRVIAKIDFSAA